MDVLKKIIMRNFQDNGRFKKNKMKMFKKPDRVGLGLSECDPVIT